jgi:hypothetical protein
MLKNAECVLRRPAVFSSFRFDNLQEEGFPNPSASSSKDEAFSCLISEEIQHKTEDNSLLR